MAEQKMTITLDPRQVADLKAFVREELAKQYGAGQAPEIVRSAEPSELPMDADGWYETTTMVDLAAGLRTFISGRTGERQVAAARVELGKLRTRIKELAGEMGTRSERSSDDVEATAYLNASDAIRELLA